MGWKRTLVVRNDKMPRRISIPVFVMSRTFFHVPRKAVGGAVLPGDHFLDGVLRMRKMGTGLLDCIG